MAAISSTTCPIVAVSRTVAAWGFMACSSVSPANAVLAACTNAGEGSSGVAGMALRVSVGLPALPLATDCTSVAFAALLLRTNTKINSTAHAARTAVVQNEAW